VQELAFCSLHQSFVGYWLWGESENLGKAPLSQGHFLGRSQGSCQEGQGTH
jgi:hypothetical protein